LATVTLSPSKWLFVKSYSIDAHTSIALFSKIVTHEADRKEGIMRVLVTGGVGVVGCVVVRKLLGRGIEPVVCDLRPDFALLPDLIDRIEFTMADVTDLRAVKRVLHDYHIDRIVHLAAFIDPDMDQQPFRAFSVNAGGTANMLEAARLSGITRFIFSSSRAVYGNTPRGVGEPGYRPLDEEHPKQPSKAYDVTKLAAEQLGQVYREAYGIEFSALRFAGIYGPGKQARHGRMSLRSRLVEDPLSGKPVRIKEGGDQLDDMIYVEDVAEALVQAVLANRLNYGAYNIASGKGQTIREFADAVRAVIPDADIEVGPGLNPFGFDVHYYAIFDISRARKDFGWEPRFDLQAGVRDYVKRLRTLQLGGSAGPA
jgi:UDP-glucose 4-epimerase